MTNEEIFVIKGLERSLLGRLAAQRLNLIKRVDTINSNEMNTNVKEKYPHLFNGLDQMKNQEYDIKVKDGATPFAIGTLRFHDALIYYAGGSGHVSTEHARGS